MSDICKINIPMLKSYEQEFKNELNNFNNRTYTTFSSSYLKNCSDAYVHRMSDELQFLYDKIKNGYQNIDKWWVDYNENVENLENYLSDNGNVGSISEPSIRNSANSLPNLKKYNIKFSGIIPSTIVGVSYNTVFTNNTVTSSVDPFSSLYSDYRISKVSSIQVIDNIDNFFDETKAYVTNNLENLWNKTTEWWNDTTHKVNGWFDEVGSDISDSVKSSWSDINDWMSDVEEWWKEEAVPIIAKATSIYWNFSNSCSATTAVFVQSLLGEGILQFGEAIVDFVALIGTGVASIVTGLYDGGQAIYGAITGNEWSSVTKKMWDGTMGFVSNKYVTGWFDSLYQNTAYGRYLAENAYGFDITRSIGSGIGYISGIVILTIATYGVGSVAVTGGSVSVSTAAAATSATQMAATATAAGIGRGTQDAWADGADLLEGLTAGILTGLWEGFQFYVGGKISTLKLFGTEGIIKTIGTNGLKTQLLNAFSRVILDGADGGIEGFVIPLISSIYKDGYYDENGNYKEFTEDENIIERYSEMFDDNGGWSMVWTQATIGSATSLVSEVFDLQKYFKDLKKSTSIDVVVPEEYLKFTKGEKFCEELSDYYGDAGPYINRMFLEGKTAEKILSKLGGQKKIDFQNFLENTIEGQYLSKLSAKEVKALDVYTDGWSDEINQMLRAQNVTGTVNGMNAQKLIDNIDSAIEKYGGLETNTELFRGVKLNAFTSKNSCYAKLFKGIDNYDLNRIYSVLKTLEGKNFGDLGYMSTSPAYNASFASNYCYPIVLDIIAEKGTPAAYVNQISNFYNYENEVLLARGTVLKIVEVSAPAVDSTNHEKIIIKCVIE